MPLAYRPELLSNYTPYFKPPPALSANQVPALKSPDTICIEFNRKLVPYLLGLLELTRWEDRFEGEEEDQAHTVGLFQELVYELLTASGCALTDQGQEQQYNFVTVYDFDCDCEEQNEMIKPMYQKFGNTWYAGFPCGDCGGVEWVPIGTGSPIDPQTGSPSGLSSGGISGGITYPASGVTVDCYASKATDYLTNRFVQFMSYVKNVSVPALDTFFTNFDEVIDTGLAIVRLTDGDSLSRELANWSLTQIKGAVFFHRQSLIDNWTYTGEVNRFQLEDWITKTIPLLSNGILIRELMLWWLRVSLIYGYNKDLALLASECASGTSGIVTVNQVEVSVGFVANLINYEAVLLSNEGWTVTKGEGTVELLSAAEVPINVRGLAWNITDILGQASCAAGNPTLHLWDDPDKVFVSGNWNNASVGWHGASEAAVETPLANALGIGSFTIYNPESDTKSGSIRVNVDCFANGGYVTIGEVWAIYEA